MMMMMSLVLVLCVLGLAEAFPINSAPSQNNPGYAFMVPVTVMGSFGPQVVLVPVNSMDWNAQRNQNEIENQNQNQNQIQNQNQNQNQNQEQSQRLTQTEQTVMFPDMAAEGPIENGPFLQLPPTPGPGAAAPENQVPQGQLFPVWNTIPAMVPLQPSVVTTQTFIPAWVVPAGGTVGGAEGAGGAGGMGGQIQVVTLAQQGAGSDSGSSEEGDTQVIYLLPVSAEIPNMGIAEAGQEGVEPEPYTNPNANPDIEPNTNPNANLHRKPEAKPGANNNLEANASPDAKLDLRPESNPNPEPNPGHLQQLTTPRPTTALVQETPAPLENAPPKAGPGRAQAPTGGRTAVTGGAVTPCKQNSGVRANANAKANAKAKAALP